MLPRALPIALALAAIPRAAIADASSFASAPPSGAAETSSSASAPPSGAADDLDEGVRFKSVAVQGNPLGFAIGRYSLDLEYLPAPHHALHATAVYYYALPGTDDQLTGPGAEVGYRWYSGRHGPHGVFVGASFVVGEYEYIHGNPNGVPLDQANDTQYVELGGALDAGWQAIILGNFAVGVGAGAEVVADTLQPRFEYPVHPWHSLLFGPGLRPRVLLQVGAAF